MKICTKCNVLKKFDDFHRHKDHGDGHVSCCRECVKKKSKDYYWKNRSSLLKSSKIYKRERRKRDPVFRIIEIARRALWDASDTSKLNHKNVYAQCTNAELRNHLESMFKPGMTWANYGKWHIDHIIPKSSAKTVRAAKALYHYTNLQPLWADENRAKGAKK